MRERRVEDHLVKRVKETGGIVRKVVFPGHRGAPDRMVGWRGKHFFVELKCPLTPTAEEHQLREHEKLRSIGFVVVVLTSQIEVEAFILAHAR